MLPHEGDDLHQAASAEREDTGCGVSNRHNQQLAFRELLNPPELAVLHQLETPSQKEDPFSLCCYRMATAMVFWDVYRVMGYRVDMLRVARALDDEVRDEMTRWLDLETGSVDMDVRDVVLSEYSRVIGVLKYTLSSLQSRRDLPDSWDNRLASMVASLTLPSSSSSDN